MGRQRFTPEQIIAKPRRVDVLVGQGSTAVEACREIGIAEQTPYRWTAVGDMPQKSLH